MDIFLARQAIFNRKKEVVAYELLFRNSLKNCYDNAVNSEGATYKLIKNILLLGLESIISNKIAFINFDENVLESDIIFLLPKTKIVIEVLETVRPTKRILERLNLLKSSGYVIALDDVISVESLMPFLPYINIIKIDDLFIEEDTKTEIIRLAKEFNVDILAEKVEDKIKFIENYNFGATYFQGYYFCKPSILKGKDIGINKSRLLQLLRELDRGKSDITRIETLIKSDIGLIYKLLKYINSLNLVNKIKVNSIKEAISIIGVDDLKKWINIISSLNLEEEEEGNDTDIFIIRAKFCEIIASRVLKEKASEAFIVGILSRIDYIIEEDMENVISELPLNDCIKGALLGEKNILNHILNLVISYENMNVKNVQESCKYLDVEPITLKNDYLNAIKWVENLKIHLNWN